jgi:hypothetical protein
MTKQQKLEKASKALVSLAQDIDYGYLVEGMEKLEIKMNDGTPVVTCPDKKCKKDIVLSTRNESICTFALVRHLKLRHKTAAQIEIAKKKEEEEEAEKAKKKEEKKKGKKMVNDKAKKKWK